MTASFGETTISQRDRESCGCDGDMARKCYRQKISSALFSRVSSSGEGCPGVLDSKEFGALFSFLGSFFPAEECPVAGRATRDVRRSNPFSHRLFLSHRLRLVSFRLKLEGNSRAEFSWWRW